MTSAEISLGHQLHDLLRVSGSGVVPWGTFCGARRGMTQARVSTTRWENNRTVVHAPCGVPRLRMPSKNVTASRKSGTGRNAHAAVVHRARRDPRPDSAYPPAR